MCSTWNIQDEFDGTNHLIEGVFRPVEIDVPINRLVINSEDNP